MKKKHYDMRRVGARCTRRVQSLDEALSLRPVWEFIDHKEIKLHGLFLEKEIFIETSTNVESLVEDVKSYDDMSKSEKKDALEILAREHGVELDKRKKLQDLEEIVNKLLGD